MKISNQLKKYLLFAWFVFISGVVNAQNNKLHIVSIEEYATVPRLHSAYYLENYNIRSKNFISSNNGKSWQNKVISFPKYTYNDSNSRRTHVASLFSKKYGIIVHFINAIDKRNIGIKRTGELKEGIYNYYLRYYISTPFSTDYIADEVIKDKKAVDEKPFEGIVRGKNAYYLGDIGSNPIELSNGKILLPIQQTILKNGELYNPANTTSYTGARVLIGTINKLKTKIDWIASDLIEVSPEKSTRGLIEPTIIELDSGKLLMIMRGSNGGSLDRSFSIPGYKWFSISIDGGYSWSSSKPLKYDDGGELFSPSSMSRLFKSSKGGIYWIGNITDHNPKGNNPRNILVIGEISLKDYSLKRKSIVIIDSQKGNSDLSHFSVIEDRETENIVVCYPFDGKWKVVKLNQ
ncbi:sialidase family protein [Sphingobacterium sp.]|uniref:sialidase family protein n=1 Tax=Sphingobacterium sp. TaxID=341027 RepID=UPI002FDB4E0B